jgi:hypothetical protein
MIVDEISRWIKVERNPLVDGAAATASCRAIIFGVKDVKARALVVQSIISS